MTTRSKTAAARVMGRPSRQRDGEAIAPVGNEVPWGFAGFHTQNRSYFDEQNKRFAEAMLAAGIVPHKGPAE